MKEKITTVNLTVRCTDALHLMNLLWIYLKSVTDMALYMTEEEALAIVKTFTEPGDVVQNCAVDLAVFDIIEFGLEDWLSWHPYHIVGMFIDMAESTLDDIVDKTIFG